MIAKLSERLDRLERAQVTQGPVASLPPEIAAAYLTAVAIALGGYPHPPGNSPSDRQDSPGDGLARGLGYRDHADMEARSAADFDDWRERVRTADAAMVARYVTMGDRIAPEDAAFRVMVGALDEIGRAKIAAPGWPAEHPRLDSTAPSIRRALALCGAASEAIPECQP